MTGGGIAFGSWVIPESAIEETFSTTGGPGGQHANRSATGVTLRLDVGEADLPEDVVALLKQNLGTSILTVTATDSRSQWRNRATARRRLAERLEGASQVRRKRRTTKPTRSSREQRISDKKHQAEKKRRRQSPEEW